MAKNKSVTPSPLALLQKQLKRQKLDGFVVPRTDEYQGEYVPPSAERLAWLTGFTGSAGTAVVLRDKAALFVDGRYTIQAAAEVDGAGVRNLPSDRFSAAALDRQNTAGRGEAWL